jgi:hypothetical protein
MEQLIIMNGKRTSILSVSAVAAYSSQLFTGSQPCQEEVDGKSISTYLLQRSATEHSSTCHCVCCLHNLLNVQIANAMGLQKKKSVRGWVSPRGMVRLEGSSTLKKFIHLNGT